MPKIRKGFLRPEADPYVFRPAADLLVEPARGKTETSDAPGVDAAEADTGEAESAAGAPEEAALTPEEQEVQTALAQADMILRDARAEAEAYRAKAMEDLAAELAQLRKQAQDAGYQAGYANGMAEATQEGQQKYEALVQEQIGSLEKFLASAARERDRMLDNSKEELKDLALAIAEKVIRISLKNSSDILLRMVDAATETHKRCEWAHIYVADCDLSGKAFTAPELTEALGHISGRIRVIPMADDESGTCIVELPDAILDASVSTQLENIKEILQSTGLDKDG